VIVDYIDAHRDRFGVEPICRVLTEHDVAIAPSTYWAHKAQPVSDADWDDAHLANTALEVWRANRSVYGADKLATAMGNAGHDIGRDHVARLMKILGIEGVTRGKHTTRTTRRDPAAARHPDLIGRAWNTPTRPDMWWVADFTYVWTLEGFVYTSFVTDVYSRRIPGWRTSSSKTTLNRPGFGGGSLGWFRVCRWAGPGGHCGMRGEGHWLRSSSMVMGSSQQGHCPPRPRLRMKVPQSSQRC
jgi:putative transposase